MAKKIWGYGNFFCTNCGSRVEKEKAYCPDCGFVYLGEERDGAPPAIGAGGVGWSDKAKHPSFKRYATNYFKVSLIWLIALSVLVPAGLLLSGEVRPDEGGLMDLGIIVGIFWLFALGFLFTKYGRDEPDWEGVVEDKQITEKTRDEKRGKEWVRVHYTEFAVFFRDQRGKGRVFFREDSNAQYDYVEIGDRVRYHGNRYLKYLEKYDKSRDEIIFCASCGQIRDIRDNYCGACGAILLK